MRERKLRGSPSFDKIKSLITSFSGKETIAGSAGECARNRPGGSGTVGADGGGYEASRLSEEEGSGSLDAETISNFYMKRATTELLENVGFTSASNASLELLTDVMQRVMMQLCMNTKRVTESSQSLQFCSNGSLGSYNITTV